MNTGFSLTNVSTVEVVNSESRLFKLSVRSRFFMTLSSMIGRLALSVYSNLWQVGIYLYCENLFDQ